MFEDVNELECDAFTKSTKEEIKASVDRLSSKDIIVGDFIEIRRNIAELTFRLECLKERMAFIDSQPDQVVIVISKDYDFTTRYVSVKHFPVGYESGLGNLISLPGVPTKKFTGKERAQAFDYAIDMVKAHPGSYIIVTGNMGISDIPARARPFSKYKYPKPTKKEKS